MMIVTNVYNSNFSSSGGASSYSYVANLLYNAGYTSSQYACPVSSNTSANIFAAYSTAGTTLTTNSGSYTGAVYAKITSL